MAIMRVLHGGSSSNLKNLARLAGCLGIEAELIWIDSTACLSKSVQEATSDGAIVVDVASLVSRFADDQLGEIADTLEQSEAAILFFVANSEEKTAAATRILTGGGITAVQTLPAARKITFCASVDIVGKELVSFAFERAPKPAVVLSLAAASGYAPIMNLDGSTAFAYFEHSRAKRFVWSTPEIFDVHRPLGAEKEFEDVRDEYIPLIIFLRAVFGERCWHSPNSGAGIVIDDPLLKEKYGLIDFRMLLQSARANRYHVTLAFIPWNHWRTRTRDAALFREYEDCFSICVHGCDHNRNEYGVADYDTLLRKNFVAGERMERHGRRTGIESEALMVCPQEKYSREAMRAFSDSRQFLALVGTACMPRDLSAPELSGADLLLPAQDSFFGFPVFKRHYSGNTGLFAIALFLGKPAILVEHHEFFKNGPSGAEEFAESIGQLRPELKWSSLLDTVQHTHTRRNVGEAKFEIRFFTDAFELKHESPERATYRLLRRVPEHLQVARVLVQGEEVDYTRENGFVAFEVEVHSPDTLAVRLDITPLVPTAAYSNGVKYQASVALRRGLSELRDNFFAGNRLAVKTGRMVANSLSRRARSKERPR